MLTFARTPYALKNEFLSHLHLPKDPSDEDPSSEEFNFGMRITGRCSFSCLIISTSFDKKFFSLKVPYHLKVTKIDQVSKIDQLSIPDIVSVKFIVVGNANNDSTKFPCRKGIVSRVYASMRSLFFEFNSLAFPLKGETM